MTQEEADELYDCLIRQGWDCVTAMIMIEDIKASEEEDCQEATE